VPTKQKSNNAQRQGRKTTSMYSRLQRTQDFKNDILVIRLFDIKDPHNVLGTQQGLRGVQVMAATAYFLFSINLLNDYFRPTN